MKNFSELLDTKLQLDIIVNGEQQSAGLHDCLTFDVDDSVTVDGIEILPKYRHLADLDVLSIPEPFYRWYHRISDQGWLLTPQ
jgi:hypothetical protein